MGPVSWRAWTWLDRLCNLMSQMELHGVGLPVLLFCYVRYFDNLDILFTAYVIAKPNVFICFQIHIHEVFHSEL